MNEVFFSLLTFPQRYEAGRLYFNIVLIPRNFSPLLPFKLGVSAFADMANIRFEAVVINSPNGLPVKDAGIALPIEAMENIDTSTRAVWASLKQQFELSEGMVIDDDEGKKSSQRAPQADTYKHIRKYLPLSYRKSFNFISARTKYALTDDSYHCAVQNKANQNDVSSERSSISWGKVIAYCLRNPLLAKKAGMIYETSIPLDTEGEALLEKGGWLFTKIGGGTIQENNIAHYAAKIPALKDLESRSIFSAVQFRVAEDAENTNSAAYDTLINEAISYDDGFAKVVHANQPVNQDLLKESDSSNPPLKDMGIRLGWEDEQIAIWFNRQMQQREELTELPVDAPLGVFGYRVDVRKVGDEDWKSQNMVYNPNAIVLPQGNIEIVPSNTSLEPAVEVHPASHGNAKQDGFWIPMYYTGWIGKALTLADKDAEDINMLNDITERIINGDAANAINKVPKKVAHAYVQEEQKKLALEYNNDYEFRVRLMDISGGGPTFEDTMIHGGDHPVERHHFKRYVAAGSMRILNVDEFFNRPTLTSLDDEMPDHSVLEHIVVDANPVLRIKRPNLAYPAVVFTGKYKNAIEQLKGILQNASMREAVDIGLPDPDVTAFTVRVEARTLEMDNAASLTGKEPYIKLYEKTFDLTADLPNGIFDQEYALKIVYKDIANVNLGATMPDLDTVAANELLLPTARNLRITLIPIIGEAAGNSYADESILEGKRTVLTSFRPSTSEELLFVNKEEITAIYLQPENITDLSHGKLMATAARRLMVKSSNTPVELSRLAEAMGLTAHNMTLEDKKGSRTQFGCSKLMRHSLAPDNSSISFSSLGELFHHWIIPIDLMLNRDWSWNGMKPESITIKRSWTGRADETVGTINLSPTANINTLHNPNRESTRMIFIDAFDPKTTVVDFPIEFTLSYSITINFKNGFSSVQPFTTAESINLPITIIPHQMPKLVSAGIALTPYKMDEEQYRFTEQRSRYLWFELEEAILDPKTTYYVRVMANAPDPLLCRVTKEMIETENQDLPLAIDAEKIRIISNNRHNDFAGMGLMQAMIGESPSGNGKKIYMVPLPQGLHSNSDELFGFFTYEIRVGYHEDVWSTAQARYGRPLKINGVQHPAPGLTCTATIKELYKPYANIEFLKLNEDEGNLLNAMLIKDLQRIKIKKEETTAVNIDESFFKKLKDTKGLFEIDKVVKGLDPVLGKKIKSKKVVVVKAPYARAVKDGKDITANAPQTSLWYLLYTQVLQADGKSYRNILVDSAMLLPPKPRRGRAEQKEEQYPYNTLNSGLKHEGNTYGTAMISLSDIKDKLVLLGLPPDNSLSVLCAEMFPMHNDWQVEKSKVKNNTVLVDAPYESYQEFVDSNERLENPLTNNLGQYRIYRTSPLVPLTQGCCDDC